MSNDYVKTFILFLIFAVIIGMAGLANAAPPGHYLEMGDKLARAAGVRLNLKIVNSDESSYSDGSLVVITTDTIRRCNSDDGCVASVIGHEIYHSKTDTGSTVSSEKAADIYGVKLANRVGYNGCNATIIMRSYIRDFGNDDGDGTHPSSSDRIRYINAICGK